MDDDYKLALRFTTAGGVSKQHPMEGETMSAQSTGASNEIAAPEVPKKDRFNWLEYKNGDDFPYYCGWPVTITGAQWAIVMVATVVSFFVLGYGLDTLKGDWLPFIPRILFVAIPLIALAFVTPKHWKAIFRKVGFKDVLWMFGFGILNVFVTTGVGAITVRLFNTASNPAATAVVGKGPAGLFAFYSGTGIQLFGEELITILPFLAIMYLCTSVFKMGRKGSVLWAWVITAVIFGLLHLPTYDWNLMQVLLTISLARLVLSLAYIKTKNIWVSTGAHILNDWALFSFPLLAAWLLANFA